MYRKLSNIRIFFRLFSLRNFSSKVPDKPVDIIDRFKLPPPTAIDKGTIEQLEKISLVNFETVEGIEIVEEAIRFADQLFLVNTEGVKPLTTVLDDTTLALREDVVTEGRCRCDILKNAKKTEDDYFVAPPGNIPLETKSYDLKRSVLK